MYLVLVRIIGSGNSPLDPKRPELPASLERPFGWNQASSLFNAEGKMLVFLPNATQEEIDQISQQEGAEIVERIGTEEQGEALVNYTKEQAPDWNEYSELRKGVKKIIKEKGLLGLSKKEKDAIANDQEIAKEKEKRIEAHLHQRRDNFVAAYRPAAERFEKLRGKK